MEMILVGAYGSPEHLDYLSHRDLIRCAKCGLEYNPSMMICPQCGYSNKSYRHNRKYKHNNDNVNTFIIVINVILAIMCMQDNNNIIAQSLLISFIEAIVCIIILLIRMINKKSKTNCLIGLICCIVIFLIAVANYQNDQINKTSTANAKTVITDTDKMDEQEYKALCTTYSYNDIARLPDSYKGKEVHFKGKVSQVVQGINNNVYLVNVTNDQYGLWQDTLYIDYSLPSGSPRILNGDIIDLYGDANGLKTYVSTFNVQTTIPYIIARYIDIDA